MVLLVSVPKRRRRDGDVENFETWAFTPTERLRGLGEKLGRTLHDPETKLTAPRVPVGHPVDLDGIGLIGWRVVQRLDRAAARAFAGDAADWDLVVIDLDNPGRAYQLTTGAGSDRAPSWTAR